MYPLLFEIPVLGGIRIYSYGVLAAAGFLIGILWIARQGKKMGVDPNLVMDLSFYVILAALVGSRILYILVEWRRYLAHPLDILKIWEGGLVFYGGLIGAMFASLVYLRRHHQGFLKIADLFMPGVALGHAIGRIGCLFAGCCYGREAPHFFAAITYPRTLFSLAPAGIPLYPSPLMEMTTELVIFLFLAYKSRRKKFDGQIFLLYIVLYSMARSVLEVFRGDSIRGFVVPGWISTSQLVSIILILVATVVYGYLRSQGRVSQGLAGQGTKEAA